MTVSAVTDLSGSNKAFATVLGRVRDFFRPTGYMSGYGPADRDAERMSADLVALDRRTEW